MKIISLLIIMLMFNTSLNAQDMHTEEELKVFKAQVDSTRALGRAQIIYTAAKSVSDDPDALINDKKIMTSVWYNNIQVKVDFEIRYPIKYLPYNTEYYDEVSIYVVEHKVVAKGGGVISNIINKDYKTKKETQLYLNTKDKKLKIEEVIKLNNLNDKANHIDSDTYSSITIREKEDHYEIQFRENYSTTYKIDKQSGKLYDYSDPYRGFYPTPDIHPEFINLIEGKWIEIKE